MPRILISYRRADAAGIAGRLQDRLAAHYGHDAVHLDIDAIPLGVDFHQFLTDSLRVSDVLLAVIGPRWLGARGDRSSRIDDPDDRVRIELETALSLGILVVPVLVDSAEMPKAQELPKSLRPLIRLNAAVIDSGRDFRIHVERLIRSLDRLLEEESPASLVPPPLIEPLPSAAVERRLTRERRRTPDRELVAGLRQSASDFFRAAGHEVRDGRHPQLLGPEPIWIAGNADPEPADIAEFAEYLAAGQRGFLVYEGAIALPTSVTLDRLRVEAKPIIPISANAISAAITDDNAAVLLADLEHAYLSNDNLFDTRNAIVDERYFFGRSELLARVGGALARSEHILITGLRKCGKTSFLNILRQHLSSRPVCFVDLQRYDRHSEDWPSELFRLVLKAYDSWGQRNFDGWPGTDAASRAVTTATQFEHQLSVRTRRQGKHGRSDRMIVILDEAERVFPADHEVAEARKYTRAASALRLLAQSSSERPLSIIVADLRPWLNRKNLLPDGSTNPFFHFFQEIALPLLTPFAVSELVRVIGSALGINKVASAYSDKLYALSGGHPSIARMIAGASYRMRAKSQELSATDLQSGLDELAATDALGFFFRENLWGAMTAEEKATLLAVVGNSWMHKATSKIRSITGAAKTARYPEASANLYDQGILRGDKIAIGSFRDWLRERGNAEA